MVTQYPHTLVFQPAPLGSDAVPDADGYWITPVSGTAQPVYHPCRAEVAQGSGRGDVVKSADGQEMNYAWAVYASHACPPVPAGTSVTVYDGVQVVAKGTVKRFAKGQLNTRLWL